MLALHVRKLCPWHTSGARSLTRCYAALGIALSLSVLLAGCGGDGDGSATRPAVIGGASTGALPSGAGDLTPADNALPPEGTSPAIPPPANGPPPGTDTPPPDPIFGPLDIQRLEVAQTHLLPDGKLAWAAPATPNASETLHLVGDREAIALVGLPTIDAVDPVIEGMLGADSLGVVTLRPPAMLPPTEAQGQPYATDLYSATLPAAWLRPGLALRAKAANYTAGTARAVEVGAGMPFTVRILPFYLFGANESNTQRPLSVLTAPPADAVAEMFAKWPIARLDIVNHPARMVQWPELVMAPAADTSGTPQPAYIARSASDYKSGFAALRSVALIVQALRAASGDAALAVHYYTPLIALDAAGNYKEAGGGIGGSSVGVGDDAYTGIFIHEQGHAFGLPHAGTAYDDGEYPYAWGSLNGSAWGYDANRKELLAPFVPSTARSFARCASSDYGGHPRTLDAAGRCVKQDPMQSGADDEAAGYRFATFSDFNTGIIQRYFEGITTLDSQGRHVQASRYVADASFASGYKAWDTLDKAWVNADTSTFQGGIRGLDRGLPQQQNVPVYAIALTINNAGTPGATQIYPPLAFTGNLVRMIDPTSATDRASIVPDTSTNYWYCRNGGCDYTLRLTYADGTVRHRLLQGGFRPFNQARGTPAPSTVDPTDPDSHEVFAVQVPADKMLARVELLSTPMAWEGMPASPQVLAQRSL